VSRVLLIEDEGPARRLARRMPGLSGHEVGEAADGGAVAF
jgi:hypothetical protein